jgi:hypothetical protein
MMLMHGNAKVVILGGLRGIWGHASRGFSFFLSFWLRLQSAEMSPHVRQGISIHAPNEIATRRLFLISPPKALKVHHKNGAAAPPK